MMGICCRPLRRLFILTLYIVTCLYMNEVIDMDSEKLAEFHKALGDKTRLRILSLLKAGERCVCELVEILGISQPTVSQHMRRLKSVQLVKERRQGRWVYYSLDGSPWFSFHSIVESLPDPEQEMETGRK